MNRGILAFLSKYPNNSKAYVSYIIFDIFISCLRKEISYISFDVSFDKCIKSKKMLSDKHGKNIMQYEI